MNRKEYLKYMHQYYLKNKKKFKEYNRQHKEEKSLWYRENYTEHPEKRKKYFEEHREEKLKYNKFYYIENKEQKSKYNKKYNKEHSPNEYFKEYRKTETGKINIRKANRKAQAKRRELGFVALNYDFEEAHAHHINKQEIIYIPKEMHFSVKHNVFIGQGMYEINVMAFDFLLNN